MLGRKILRKDLLIAYISRLKILFKFIKITKQLISYYCRKANKLN